MSNLPDDIDVHSEVLVDEAVAGPGHLLVGILGTG